MNQKQVRLSNNQSHELFLYQVLVTRLQELKKLGRLDVLDVETSPGGFNLTVEENSQFKITYSVSLFPNRVPLRVIATNAKMEHKSQPFKLTRALLLHLIEEVEAQICWVRADLEKWAEIEQDEQPEEWEDEEPEEFVEVNFGDGPGGLKAYE